jgi:hypothetical protein
MMISQIIRLLTVAMFLSLSASSQPSRGTPAPGRAEGVAAFQSLLPALHHPRCMVCHSSGDYPRQGDDLHPHIMDVRRGVSGDGVAPVYCSSCHQTHNLPGVHVPPGALDWHLPSAKNPMVWEGLSDRQLCQLLTDPQRNGGRNAHGIQEHMNTPLVLWGWNPGEGRAPVSLPLNRFLKSVQTWTAAGAPCPQK